MELIRLQTKMELGWFRRILLIATDISHGFEITMFSFESQPHLFKITTV